MNEETAIEPNAEPTTAEGAETSKPKVEKRFAKLTSQLYHKDAELNQLKAEVETLKATQKPVEPEAPALPDEDLRYDKPDEYQARLKEYNKHIAKQAYAEVQQEAAKEQESLRAKEQQLQSQKQHQEIIDRYIDNGLEAGISEDKMIANEQVLKSANLDQGVLKEIYSDANGAKIVDYLVDNPDKMQELASMSSYRVMSFIDNQVLPQALSTKPSLSNAPPPTEPTRGGGTPPKDWFSERHPKAVIK